MQLSIFGPNYPSLQSSSFPLYAYFGLTCSGFSFLIFFSVFDSHLKLCLILSMLQYKLKCHCQHLSETDSELRLLLHSDKISHTLIINCKVFHSMSANTI